VIVFSHRSVAAVIGIAVVAFAIQSTWIRHKHKSLLPLVPVMVRAHVLQSEMGTTEYPLSESPLAALVILSQVVAAESSLKQICDEFRA